MRDFVSCEERLVLTALSDVPVVGPETNLADIVLAAVERSQVGLRSCDVLVLASKLVARAEGRFVDLSALRASQRARKIAQATGLDARFVELVLREATEISRIATGALIVRNRLGVVCANAGVDLSNARPLDAAEGSGPWALALPRCPDDSARALQREVEDRTGIQVAVVISDSLGRPFRLGSVGAAVGLSGLPPLSDYGGDADLFGRRLEHTVTAVADQLAAAADLVAGQGAERRAVVHVRGLRFAPRASSARELLRPKERDLYGRQSERSGD